MTPRDVSKRLKRAFAAGGSPSASVGIGLGRLPRAVWPMLLLLLRSSSQHDFLFSLHRVVLKFSLKHAHLHTPGTWALRQDAVASKRPHPPREWKEVKKETAVQLILSVDVFL